MCQNLFANLFYVFIYNLLYDAYGCIKISIYLYLFTQPVNVVSVQSILVIMKSLELYCVTAQNILKSGMTSSQNIVPGILLTFANENESESGYFLI